MVRWDSPLFTIPWDEDPPLEDIWNTITKGDKKPPTAAVNVVSSHLLLFHQILPAQTTKS